MIKLRIWHDSQEKEINLSAENMREMIDEKLPDWIPMFEADWPLIKKTRRYEEDPVHVERDERASGWYYDLKE